MTSWRSEHYLTCSALLLAAGLLVHPWYAAWVSSRIGRVETGDNAQDADTCREAEESTNDDKKKYEVKTEYYSVMDATWATRDVKENDADDSLLFTAAFRSWPKSADYAGFVDYINVAIKAQPLIDILRLGLKDIEPVFDDVPEIEADDIFLQLPHLDALLVSRKKEQELLENTEKEASLAKKQGSLDEGVAASDLAIAPPSPSSATKPVDAPEDDIFGLTAPKGKTSADLAIECDQLAVLLTYIHETFAPIKSKLERFKVDNVMSFRLLWTMFPIGQIVETTDEVSGEKTAFILKYANYRMQNDTMVFLLNGTRVVFNGNKYVVKWLGAVIPKYKGMRKISSLPASPISDSHRTALTERGRMYKELSKVSFLEYTGSLIKVVGCGRDRRITKRRAEGRAVVDVKSYRRMNPSSGDDDWEHEDEDENDDGLGSDWAVQVPEAELCLFPPTVFGFSLVQRDWGQMLVTQFEKVTFSASAFDSLVLDPAQKTLIRSLVEQNTSAAKVQRLNAASNTVPASMQDFIQGKGGGLVVACHGRPGTGKTLTAEAIAELLEVPLYVCGAGELGTDPGVLETRLRDILDVAATWGAVVLIDEAEVFLTARSVHDVVRNALVSVFLRLLEYHSGVLILTTNRVRDIDPAFASRFSLGITYPDLDFAKRRTIWASFVRRAGAVIAEETSRAKSATTDGLPTPSPSGASSPVPNSFSASVLDTLAKKPLNGRSIKNIVRTAQSLASSKRLPLAAEHIWTVLKVSEDFSEALKDTDEEGVYDAKGEGWKDKTSVYM